MRFLLIGFIGRLPVAMVVVGVLTVVTATRSSLSDAGWASATVGLASGFGGPLIGIAADRWGQRWVLTVVAIVNSVGLAGIMGAVHAGLPLPTIMACSVIVGLASPMLAPMARARWIGLVQHAETLQPAHINAAMAYESTADEITFIVGPVLVGVLATLVNPYAPIVLSVAITLTFVISFAWHESAHYASRGRGNQTERIAPLRSLGTPRLIIPLLGMATIGLLFGSTLTSLTGFMAAINRETQTGLVYGAMSITSAGCSLAVGLLPERFSLWLRWPASTGLTFLAALLVPGIHTPWMAALVLLLMGIGIGPALVTVFGIAAAVAPVGRLTTVMTLFGTSIGVGQSLGTLGVSQLVTAYGYHAGFLAVLTVAGLLLLLSVLNVPLGRRHIT